MKQVRCVETGEVYQSASAAARAKGVTPGMIHHVLKGRQRTAAGYKWEYTGRRGVMPVGIKRRKVNRIIRDSSGATYETIASLARHKGISPERARYLMRDDGFFDDSLLPISRGERYILQNRSDAPRHIPRIRIYAALDRFAPVVVYLSQSGWVFEPAAEDLFAPIRSYKI